MGSHSEPFENFLYTYARLDALYIEFFEEENDYKETMKELIRESLIIQLVAMADVYKSDLTEALLRAHLDVLRANRKQIINLLCDASSPTPWENLFEEIIATGVGRLTRQVAYKKWINNVQSQFLPTLSVNNNDIVQFEEIIATRNILAHNRGIINDDYLKRSEEFYRTTHLKSPTAGEKRKIDESYCMQSMRCLKHLIESVDNQAAPILL